MQTTTIRLFRARQLAVTGALAALSASAGATGASPAAARTSPFQPLAFLVGHCWKGTFQDGSRTDEHCFSWIYGGKFVRDRHTVHAEGRADGHGESIYFWNPGTNQLEYLYIESEGGFSQGSVSSKDGALIFPATQFVQDGQTQTYRSRWQSDGKDAYEVLAEFQGKDSWVPGFRLRMEKVAAK